MTKAGSALTGIDAALLQMERPTNLMMVTGVAMLDEPITLAQLRETLETRLLTIDERFRMKVVTGRLSVGTPRWEKDPDFNLDAHLQHLALPAPGDEAALRTLIGDLASRPIDFSKSPWQMHLVDNVQGGSALVVRFHHCVADGTSVKYIMAHLMDMERVPTKAPVLPPAQAAAPRRSRMGRLFSPVKGALNISKKTAGLLIDEGREVIQDPGHLLERAELAAESIAVIGRLLVDAPDPATPFKGALGVQKQVAWTAALPLEEVKFVAQALDAKINDILMAAMAGALGAYLRNRDVDVADLKIHAVVPVDLRSPDKAHELGNGIGLAFVGLPLGIEDSVLRLAAIQKHMDEIKQSPEAAVFLGLLNVFGYTPPLVEEQALKLFAAHATAVLTNVAGPRETLYLAGSRINHVFFWVPQSGRVAMGISIMSYAGEVILGVITDARLVPDPTTITDLFDQEFAAMSALARDVTTR